MADKKESQKDGRVLLMRSRQGASGKAVHHDGIAASSGATPKQGRPSLPAGHKRQRRIEDWFPN